MKDYMRSYTEGGAAMAPPAQQGPPAQAAGEQGEGGNPEAQLQGMLQEYSSNRSPELAMQICDMLVQAMGAGSAESQSAGQQAPPADAGAGAPPAGANGMRMPMHKKGGVVGKKPMSAMEKFQAAKMAKKGKV